VFLRPVRAETRVRGASSRPLEPRTAAYCRLGLRRHPRSLNGALALRSRGSRLPPALDGRARRDALGKRASVHDAALVRGRRGDAVYRDRSRELDESERPTTPGGGAVVQWRRVGANRSAPSSTRHRDPPPGPATVGACFCALPRSTTPRRRVLRVELRNVRKWRLRILYYGQTKGGRAPSSCSHDGRLPVAARRWPMSEVRDGARALGNRTAPRATAHRRASCRRGEVGRL
jgi:hypothetical protein